jgi:hypothetical protein
MADEKTEDSELNGSKHSTNNLFMNVHNFDLLLFPNILILSHCQRIYVFLYYNFPYILVTFAFAFISGSTFLLVAKQGMCFLYDVMLSPNKLIT